MENKNNISTDITNALYVSFLEYFKFKDERLHKIVFDLMPDLLLDMWKEMKKHNDIVYKTYIELQEKKFQGKGTIG